MGLMGSMCERVAMYQPKLIKHLLTHNCETGQPVGKWGLGLGFRLRV